MMKELTAMVGAVIEVLWTSLIMALLPKGPGER